MKHGDAAQIQVLEAVLLAVIMLGAIGFVLTFTLPTSETEPARHGLERRAEDALAVMAELPSSDSKYGSTMLSYAVAKALEGDSTELVQRLQGLLPPATKFYVSIHNGKAETVVYDKDGSPIGESVTSNYLLEPDWAYSFVSRDASTYSGPATMGVYALPVTNSNVITDGGVPVEVSATFSLNGNEWTVKSVYTTVQGATDADGDAVSSTLFGSDAAGFPKPFHRRIDASGVHTGENVLYVTVEQNETSGTIPAGTELVVRVPPGQQASLVGLGNADWDPVDGYTHVAATSGGTLKATFKTALDGVGKRTLAFYANYSEVSPERPYDFYVFDAVLGGPVYGKAEIVVQDHRSSTFTGGDYVDVYASVPKPMGRTARTTWTVTAVNAALEPSVDSQTKLVRIEVRQPDGIPLFSAGSIEGIRSPDGTTEPTIEAGNHAIVWDPPSDYAFTEFTAVDLVFAVEANAQTTRNDAQPYLVVPVSVYDDDDRLWTFNLTRRIEEGLFYGQVPPHIGGQTAGYAGETGVDHPFWAAPTYKNMVLNGTWTYQSGPVVKDFLSTVDIDVEPRLVPAGEELQFSLNLQNLLSEYLLQGFDIEAVLNVYAPWTLDTHTDPIQSWEIVDTTALRDDVTQVVAEDVTGDGVRDVIVATSAGRLTAYDTAEDGVPITGKATQWNGQYVRRIEPITVDGSTYFIVGLSKDAGAKPTLKNVHVLDDDLDNRLAAFSMGGGVDVSDVVAGVDVDADGVPDYGVTTTAGSSALFDGDEIRNPGGPQVPFWEQVKNVSAAYAAMGVNGPHATPTFITTTGAEVDVRTWNPYDIPTNAGEVPTYPQEQLKKVTISTSDGAMFGWDEDEGVVWQYPTAGYRVLESVEFNTHDATTDVVAGTWNGLVHAINGTQAAWPWSGLTILSGTQILDADYVDLSYGWTINAEGMAMYTKDAMVSKDYGNPTALLSAPGGRGIDAIDRAKGFIVGDGGIMYVFTVSAADVAQVAVHSYTITGNLTLYGKADYKDVEFLNRAKGVVVGGACTLCLGRSVPIFTVDGGATWTKAAMSDAAVTLPSTRLNRVHWADATTVYAVGDLGNIYRSADGGATWGNVVKTNATDEWFGVHCLDGMKCWAVGSGGRMMKTTDGFATWAWAHTTVSVDLKDVEFYDEKEGIAVGKDTTVLVTKDGGKTWVSIPGIGPLEADWNVVEFPGKDIAYFWGGNVTTRAYGTTATHESTAQAVTKTLFTVPATLTKVNPKVTEIQIEPKSSNNEFTSIVYEASTDGGTTWTTLVTDHPADDLNGKKKWDKIAVANPGADVKMRFTLRTELDKLLFSPSIRNLTFNYTESFTCGVDVALCKALTSTWCDDATKQCSSNLTFDAQIWKGTFKDAANTTAEWENLGSAWEIRLPRIDKFWVRNLRAHVNDLDASRDVNGDGFNDVVVATGAVDADVDVAGPERIDKVFLLNGLDGRTLATFDPPEDLLVAEPWRVRFADLAIPPAHPKGGTPEVVLTVFDRDPNSDPGVARVFLLEIDLANSALKELDVVELNGRPDVLKVVDMHPFDGTASDDFLVGTTSFAPDPTVSVPGQVFVYPSTDSTGAGDGQWTLLVGITPDFGGVYVKDWTVPAGYMYGPYPVEVAITWTKIDTRNGLTKTVQTLNLMDYVSVVPASGRAPVSPVYTVHLVTWFEDWDYVREG